MNIFQIQRLRQSFRNFTKTQRLLAGVYSGKWSFNAPDTVQIDIANTCANACLACWTRSPLLKTDVSNEPIHNMQLPYPVIERVVNELAEAGTPWIYLAGGGDLFTHPRIADIVSLIKRRNMKIVMHANFVNCTEDLGRKLTDTGIDLIVASVWAGSPETYVATHPDKTVQDFQRMTRVLKILSGIRDKGGEFKIHNVIMKQNYHELEKMVEYGIAVGVNVICFVLVDIVPDETDSLLLDESERSDLLAAAERIWKQLPQLKDKNGLELADFDYLLQRLRSQDAGIGAYDREVIKNSTCYTGFRFLRVLADGNVNSCLKSWRYPLGNVNTESIMSIWNNSLQQEFRTKGIDIDANREYFRLMGFNPSDEAGCYRTCDNLQNILDVRHTLESKPRWRHALAKLMLPYYRK